MAGDFPRPLAEVWGEQIAEAIRPLAELAQRAGAQVDVEPAVPDVEPPDEQSTVYSASVTSPGGITFTASVVVPESAAYPDQLELTETVQMASATMASGFKRAENIRARREPF